MCYWATGRAAKVIANYSAKPAFTIHKKQKNGGGYYLQQQNASRTIHWAAG
jgi:hypothetical protein